MEMKSSVYDHDGRPKDKSYLECDGVLEFAKVETCNLSDFFKSVNKCVSVYKEFS